MGTGQQAGMTEKLREGDVCFLVGGLADSSPGKGIGPQWPLDDPLVGIARADHPLCDGGNTLPPWQELARYSWVVDRQGTPMRRTWENLFTEAGVDPPRARVTSRSLLAIRALLLEGDYLALLNLGQVALDVDNGLISIIGAPLPDASIPVGITYRTGWEPTPLQREFLQDIDAEI